MDWFFAYFSNHGTHRHQPGFKGRLQLGTPSISRGDQQRGRGDPYRHPRSSRGSSTRARRLQAYQGTVPLQFPGRTTNNLFSKSWHICKKLFCRFLGPLGFLEVKGPQSSTPQSGTPPQLEVGIQKGNQNCLLIDSICPVNENIFLLIYTVFEVASSKFGSKWIWFQIYWKALQK